MSRLTITRAACFVLALNLLAGVPFATGYTIELPQVLGTHEQAELSFTLSMPALSGFSSAHLEMSGSQIAGVRADCTTPPYEIPAGAGFRCVVALPGAEEILFDVAEAQLSDADTEWTVSVPFMPNAPGSVFSLSGPLAAEFSVGDIFAPVTCYALMTFPVVTITSARIVTDGIVAADNASWGMIRQLYR